MRSSQKYCNFAVIIPFAMRITFLVDNLPHPTLPLLTEHGLSMYIDQITPNSSLLTPNSILCDMGASGAYLKNAKALGIDLSSCNWAFLSHAHADHTGGLGKWIAQYGHIPVYASHRIATDEYFSSRPKRVEGRKSKVESLCKVSAEASLLDYAEPQPDFMSEANKDQCKVSAESFNRVIDESYNCLIEEPSTIQRERSEQINDSTSKRERSDLRYIGPDLNLFHGHTPWFKPIEQNTWITPHIALAHPTCNQYPKPLGNKYLTVVASRKSKVESQCKVSAETSLLDYAEPQPDFMSEANKVESQRFNDSAIQPERSENDPFLHEIALCFVTPKGLVIVSCCSHHGALNTIASCMEFTGCNTLHAYIGGLHFVDSPEVEAETSSFISDWLTLYPNAHLYTGHCTCLRAATMLKAHLPHCHTFYTGMVVEV